MKKLKLLSVPKVRRNNLSYLRNRSGKSARLVAKDFDRVAVNTLKEDVAAEAPAEAPVEAEKTEEIAAA